MLRTITLTTALALGAAAPASLAGNVRYEQRRIPGGPRADRYVPVRVDRDRDAAAERPYALTGESPRRAERKVVQRWIGSHYIGPVFVLESADRY